MYCRCNPENPENPETPETTNVPDILEPPDSPKHRRLRRVEREKCRRAHLVAKEQCRGCGASLQMFAATLKSGKKSISQCITCQSKYHQKGKTLPVRFYYAKFQAKDRKIPWLLTFDEYSSIASNVCGYCQLPFETLGSGLDRLDPFGPYSKENCVSCCEMCNRVRFNQFSVNEMLYIMGPAVRTLKQTRNKIVSKRKRFDQWSVTVSKPRKGEQFLSLRIRPGILLRKEGYKERRISLGHNDLEAAKAYAIQVKISINEDVTIISSL